jgi:hypothetical protein
MLECTRPNMLTALLLVLVLVSGVPFRGTRAQFIVNTGDQPISTEPSVPVFSPCQDSCKTDLPFPVEVPGFGEHHEWPELWIHGGEACRRELYCWPVVGVHSEHSLHSLHSLDCTGGADARGTQASAGGGAVGCEEAGEQGHVEEHCAPVRANVFLASAHICLCAVCTCACARVSCANACVRILALLSLGWHTLITASRIRPNLIPGIRIRTGPIPCVQLWGGDLFLPEAHGLCRMPGCEPGLQREVAFSRYCLLRPQLHEALILRGYEAELANTKPPRDTPSPSRCILSQSSTAPHRPPTALSANTLPPALPPLTPATL